MNCDAHINVESLGLLSVIQAGSGCSYKFHTTPYSVRVEFDCDEDWHMDMVGKILNVVLALTLQ